MHLYRELLQITEEIESSLKSEILDGLTSLQVLRAEKYKDIQLKGVPEENREKATAIITLIQSAESRCLALAAAKQDRISENMTTTRNTKKLNTAYGRQILAH